MEYCVHEDEAYLRMKGVVCKTCLQHVRGAETWMMKVGVFQRLQAIETNAENDLRSDVEG